MSAWLPRHIIGGSTSGGPFEIFGGNSGRFVRTIRVHYNRDNLFGISVTWTDGTNSPQIGRAQHSLRSITFSEGETVVRASLWGNGRGTRSGRIFLQTSRGQILDAGRDTRGQDEFIIDVGSGRLGGFVGRHGHEIDSLGFTFLRPITSVEITDVRYDALPPNSNIGTTVLTQTEFANLGSNNLLWRFANAVDRTDTTVWELSAFIRFGGGVRVRAGIPGIVSVTGQFQWEVGAAVSWEQTTSTSLRHGWDIGGTLTPRQRILATSTLQVGTADVPFSSTVTIRLNNGAILSYQERGILRNVQHSFARASYVDLSGRGDFHSEEPFPNDDGKVPVVPGEDPAGKDDDGKLVATKDLEAHVGDDGKLPAVPT